MSRSIVSGVLVLVLIVTLLFSRQVSTECISETEVSSHSMSAYENATTHEGDLIIDGTQTFIIENCTYVQTGNVHVKDWGKLIIRNADIQMNQAYFWEYKCTAEGYASLEMENVLWNTRPLINFNFNFLGFSSVTISSSNFDENTLSFNIAEHSYVSIKDSRIFSVETWDTPTIKFINSTVTWRFGLRFDEGSTVKINKLEPGTFEYMDLKERVSLLNEGISQPMHITLNQTYVDGWHICAYYDSETIVTESVIWHFRIFLRDVSVTLDNLRPQYYDYLKTGQIIFNRTRVSDDIGIETHGYSKATIINSTVSLCLCDNSNVELIRSSVTSLNVGNFYGSIGAEMTPLSTSGFIFCSEFLMYGNITFQGSQTVIWVSSNVTRNYNVIIRDTSNNASAEAELTLFDRKDAPVWNGTTDSLGQADFNLTFTDNNYTDTLRLEAVKGNYSALANVTFLSDTPIILKMRYFADLNSDGMINILDVSIVANAYNSRPGDVNWNAMADLNKDEVINILDISRVAKDFGKAVSHNGEVDFFFSFEDDMQEWEARAMDLELGNSTIEWSIVQSQERAKNGSSALKFYLENWNDMGKIWIERCFVVKPNTMYGANVSYAFASADWGVANFFRIITGVLQEPPKTRDELVYQGDTGNDHPDSDVGYVWLDKSYAFTFQSNANGETYVILGVWGVWETPRTYYLDSIRVVFTQL